MHCMKEYCHPNDVGSFILYKNKKPFIIDLGVGSYTKKTFSKDRYDIWTMQSQYHNLPNFYDAEGHLIMEHDGEDFRATDVICHMDETGAELSMELRKAYTGYNCLLLKKQ
ncbi:MAG: heparinase II/III family protein [Oribacterium sp.]|nr:heparinase II/III family protein [Oribacterium sp.]